MQLRPDLRPPANGHPESHQGEDSRALGRALFRSSTIAARRRATRRRATGGIDPMGIPPAIEERRTSTASGIRGRVPSAQRSVTRYEAALELSAVQEDR